MIAAKLRKKNILSWAVILIGVWYISICVMHLQSRRPLWLDEQMVFASVEKFTPHEFFSRKLEYDQIFPRVYLFCIQQVSKIFDFDLVSVRFLSFAAMLAGFSLWVKLAKEEIKSRGLFATYLLSWAGSSLLVYYSAELKPYAMDVFVSGVFMLFLFNADYFRDKKKPIYLTGMTLLPLLGLFSYPAFLFFVFLFYHLVTTKTKDAFWLQSFLSFGFAAVLALGFVYMFDIRIAKANTSTQGFSDHVISFASAGAFFKSWWEGTMDLFCRFFADRPRIFKRWSVLFGLIAFVGMIAAFIKNFAADGYRLKSFRTIALVLYAELCFLGALQKYPFSVPRTSLFFCPIVLLLIIEAIGSLRKTHKPSAVVLQWVYISFLSIIAFGIAREAWGGHLGFSPVIY